MMLVWWSCGLHLFYHLTHLLLYVLLLSLLISASLSDSPVQKQTKDKTVILWTTSWYCFVQVPQRKYTITHTSVTHCRHKLLKIYVKAATIKKTYFWVVTRAQVQSKVCERGAREANLGNELKARGKNWVDTINVGKRETFPLETLLVMKLVSLFDLQQ